MATIIIAEKPDAAMRIAQALSQSKPVKKTSPFGVDYYEFERNGKKHLVVAAVGHLFNLKQSSTGWTYPIFDADWVPSYQAIEKSAFSEKYFKTIEWIAKNCGKSQLISAADYDNEGALIAWNIIRFIFKQKDAKRMKFSVDYNEDLLILQNGNAKIVKIGKFVDENISKLGAHNDGYCEIADVSNLNLKTFSFDPVTFKTSYKKITKVIRHPITDELIEIKLESGRKVRVTDGHNLFVLRNNNLSVIPTTDLKTGDYVIAPLSLLGNKHITELDISNDLRNFKINKNKCKWKLPQKIPLTAEFLRLIGYYLSEGCCGNRHVELSFGSHEKDLIEDAVYCVKKIFYREPKLRIKKTCTTVYFGGKVGVILFDKILKCGRTSDSKEIPDFIFNVRKNLILEFVKALLNGDGTVSGYGIMLNTSSKNLVSKLLYLFLKLGIYAGAIEYTNLHKGPDGKLRNQKVYRFYIQNKYELNKLAKFFPEWIKKCNIYRNNRKKTNRRGNFKETYTAIPILETSLKISNRKEKIGRRALKKIINKFNKNLFKFYSKLINSNLAFLKVVAINKVKATSNYVYDISVERNENFTCGFGGIFLHNSTLTKPDLIKAYEESSNHLDWPNIISGETRHWLDWIWGINASRALTLAVKKYSPRFSILSAGRVQGPVLSILAQRELEIKKFKPKPFWQLQLILLINGQEVIAIYEKEKFWEKNEAEKIYNSCKNKVAIVQDVVKKKYKQAPPVPFNITSLQTEAYRFFGFSPQQTLNIAQNLYTNAVISYPRTSSQKLPPQVGYREILEALSKIKKYESLCKTLLALPELKPIEGKLTDPAHESIHPTVEPPKDIKELTNQEQKIYDLICRRFFAVFAKEAIRESMQVLINVNGFKFLTTGRRTLEKGWMEFYGPYAKFDEIIFPELNKGDKLNVKKLELLSKKTEPPARYSQASIIKLMEQKNLGTRATRAAILQTLYDRGYILDKSIRVTSLGLELAKVLKNYVPDFVDEKLTREFEKDLEEVFEGKTKKEKVIEKAKKAVTLICKEFKENEDKIGKELGKAIMETQEDKNTLGVCNKCGGNLKVLFSIFTKKYFVGCTGYNKCKVCGFSKSACKCKCPICGQPKGKCKCSWKDKKWTPLCEIGYPLPANATFQRTEKICEKCGTPIIRVLRKGKRPFNMCLDPNCETKKDWGKPKASKKSKKL
ncbi:MAG: DNA topoisomerase I [Candidatus Aenigmatarchaeota archaeon]